MWCSSSIFDAFLCLDLRRERERERERERVIDKVGMYGMEQLESLRQVEGLLCIKMLPHPPPYSDFFLKTL